ncbi:SPOR domain-containing protein [Roseovarius faecimaris]|uniref:SPOR domain-containing protein n=1 Tax=Roseovarius faecimaris TaxID=2494550 RepID=A0A6I6IQX0_9RHOB|nr:SPOR domain-containing protein [Roseovarius faecimaris]QGX98632.1 SPOR domain-containing protein [Roseovarius faecimaris]
MGDMHDTRPLAASGQKSSLGTATNLVGAAVSLALLVGVGVWGYKLIMRDVSGVPVVRAAEGPMRVQPEDPGGMQAQNQGLSVNDVAAEGTAAAPADRLVLAPAPLDITEEDAVLAKAALADEPAGAAQTRSAAAIAADTEDEETVQLAALEALAAQLADGVEPLSEVTAAIEPRVDVIEEAAATAPVELPEVKGGLKRSLRPVLRPATLNTSAPSEAIAAAVARVLDVDPETIPVGTRLAQLGAYDSAEVARAEWDRLNGRFAEYLEGKQRVVQKAQSGGRTFYRLRAMGFADLSDARRFCSALVAEKAECIPVVTR